MAGVARILAHVGETSIFVIEARAPVETGVILLAHVGEGAVLSGGVVTTAESAHSV